MTEDEARADPCYPDLVKRYEAAGYSRFGPGLPAWYALREIREGKPCVFEAWTDENGVRWSRSGANEPEMVEEKPAAPARDPKRDPLAGDVLEDDGWAYTVESFGPDSKGRKLVAYTVRWTFEGEAREEKRTAQLGAWRHLWRLAGELRRSVDMEPRRGELRVAAKDVPTGSDTSVQDRSEPAKPTQVAKAHEEWSAHRDLKPENVTDRDVKPENILPEQRSLFS